MRISIIIVSWNVKELLQKCLQSIYNNQGSLDLEIFVVDNNSKDNSVAMVKKEFPEVNLIVNDKNVGFARANNQALKKATGDYVLFLNPDTELIDGALEKSVEFMNQNQECGIMGPQILNPNKSIQPSVRRYPKVWPIFLMLIKAPKVFKNIKSINHYLNTDFNHDKTQAVDQVMGAYMFVRKELLDKLGGFDPNFFIWFEEVDLCQRFSKAGYLVIYNPQIKIIHYGGQSFTQQNLITNQWRFFKSAFRYFIKDYKSKITKNK